MFPNARKKPFLISSLNYELIIGTFSNIFKRQTSKQAKRINKSSKYTIFLKREKFKENILRFHDEKNMREKKHSQNQVNNIK